jgi:transposase
VQLVLQGFSHREAAEAVGCVPSSVSRWMKVHREEGDEGLKAKPEPQRRFSALKPPDREKLRAILLRGASQRGHDDDLWDLRRVRKVIQEEFGLTFHIGHVHRILRDVGFSAQRPETRARQQDPAKVAAFREETWPALKKGRGTRVGRSSSSTKADS